MNELRYERERRGWTLDDVASRTRIPRTYLEALEDGNHEVLPPGPFFRGYLRQYLEFLGEDHNETLEGSQGELDQKIEQTVAAATSAAMESSQRMPLLRLVITGFVLTLAIVLAMKVGHRITTKGEIGPDGAPLPAGPPHKLTIYAIEDVHLGVKTDGKHAFSDNIRGSTSISFKANDTLEVDISDLGRVRLTYNDKRIEPLGSLSRERRLVFMHEPRD
mgnify:CR=1 FL=1